jgi:RNA polymerase sigma-70 factor, ECF subfamily
MTETGWIGSVLTAARPQAVAALLRYFRNIDMAEEAFQEASLRALKTWPKNGPPRDAAAWLIMVGKNAGVDAVRRTSKQVPLPPEALISDLSDVETATVEQLDAANYRDDILRLLFICCHPDLPATQQIALALRIVSGLSVKQIARAFLVTEAAMEQRITRAKSRVADAEVPFEAPGPAERSERVAAVAAMIYLIFNEGYTAVAPSSRAENGTRTEKAVSEQGAKAMLCEEAIRLARLLLGLYPAEPEIMGLTALVLLQHARAAARFDGDGAVVLLEDQDRALWNPKLIAEGLALIDKAVRHRQPGPYQVQAAIAALHAQGARAADTDWSEIELLYGTLERMQPSPVVTLNRAVAVSKARGPEAALAMIEPLAAKLGGYFYFHGARGAFLKELGRAQEARMAFDRAISLANTPAEAAHIRMQIDRLTGAR